jgi:predicted dehydrogenase
MAVSLTPEEKIVGKDNFHRVVGKLAIDKEGVTRRTFMKGLLAAGATVPVAAAAYFGYTTESGEPYVPEKPVRAGLIGAGDEGGVLVGEHNPKYLQFVAYSDIRPSNQKRIVTGELLKSPNSPRRGFNFHYGKEEAKKIKLYEDYRELLKHDDIELVVIALPLHLHAQVAIDAMKAKKHVLCEKLMAWNIKQCKDMIRVADETGVLLSIGHQRHYSMLYAHAVEVLKSGILGDINHIRAQWHRNNTAMKMKGDKPVVDRAGQSIYEGGWRPPILEEDEKALSKQVKNAQGDWVPRYRLYGFKDMDELVRWRLYQRTGGGLMAELGSHQLDASSIFLTALSDNHAKTNPDHKVHPLAVSAVGGKYFYNDESEVEDHVFCTYEFPGKGYKPTRSYFKDGKAKYDDVVVVTYSSINTNAFEPYGECVMGSKGTMIIEMERDVMLFGGSRRSTAVTVANAGGGKPALDSSGSTDPGERLAQNTGQAAIGLMTPSRGYREEMEHLAYLIRMRQEGSEKDAEKLKPRCDGRAAMADAIIALTANVAMQKQQRIVFDPAWFDPKSNKVPDADRIATTVG